MTFGSIYTFLDHVHKILCTLGRYFITKVIASWLLGVVAYLVGGENMQILGTLTALVVIDLITGVYSAYKTGEHIESRKMVKTAIKWTLYMLMVSAAHLAETLLPTRALFTDTTVAFLGLTELVSILENIGRCGVAIPKRLLNQIDSLRNPTPQS